MKRFKEYIIEKRRNPQLNDKVGVIEKLIKYSNYRDETYVSFRNINKIGINPQSKFSTPNGIYCYNLQRYEYDLKQPNATIESVFPFTGDDTAKFAYVFQPKEDTNLVYLGEMTENEVIKYMSKWFTKYPESTDLFAIDFHINNKKEELEINEELFKGYKKLAKAKNWNEFVKYLVETEINYKGKRIKLLETARTRGDIFNALRFSFPYDIFSPLEKYGIDSIPPLQKKNIDIMYDNPEVMKIVSDMIDFEDVKEDIDNLLEKIDVEIISLLDDLEGLGYDASASSKDFKNLSRWLFNNCKYLRVPPPKYDSNGSIFWWFGWVMFRKNPNQWNKFFREIGVDGVIDDGCEGIIHESEKCQGVFFDKTKLNVLESIPNKQYKISLFDIKVKNRSGEITQLRSLINSLTDNKDGLSYDESRVFIVTINKLINKGIRRKNELIDYINDTVIPKIEEVTGEKYKLLL